MFLLGGTLAFNELQIDKAEQRHLNEHIYSSSGSHVPYIEGLAAFHTNITPIIFYIIINVSIFSNLH